MTIKKHKRREIGEWEHKNLSQDKSHWIYLYVAGNYNVAENECRKACFPSGLCVTIEKVKYIFGGGSEDGVRVGFINYPPFPEDFQKMLFKAEKLGQAIADSSSQFSFSLVTSEKIHFYSRVK